MAQEPWQIIAGRPSRHSTESRLSPGSFLALPDFLFSPPSSAFPTLPFSLMRRWHLFSRILDRSFSSLVVMHSFPFRCCSSLVPIVAGAVPFPSAARDLRPDHMRRKRIRLQYSAFLTLCSSPPETSAAAVSRL